MDTKTKRTKKIKVNVIEINGRRYDVFTGTPIGHTPGRTIPVQDYSAAPAPRQPASSRQPARKLSSHAPQRSTTLMRTAVKKPSASLKRRIRAQGHTGVLAAQPAAAIVPKLSFGNLDNRRLNHANLIKKSQSITHFSQGDPAYAVTVTVTTSKAKPAPVFTPKAPKKQPSTADIFERAIQQATSHLEPAPKIHRKHRLGLARHHARV